MNVRQLSAGDVTRTGLSVGIVALALYVLTSLFDVSRAIDVLLRANLAWFAFATVAYYVTFPIRTARWVRFLRKLDVEPDWLSANVILLVNFYLNLLVPAKLGDVYRGRKGATLYESSTSSVLGTVAAERVVDLTVLVLGLLVTIPLVLDGGTEFRERGLLWASAALAVLVVGTAVVLYSDRLPLPERVLGVVERFSDGFSTVRSDSNRTRSVIWGTSVVIWTLNVVRTWAVANALDITLDIWSIVLLALLVAFLSGLPYTPAGVGVVEVIGSSVLVTLGLTGPEALALVLLDRIVSVVMLVLPGTGLYLYVASRGIPTRNPRDDDPV